MSTVFSGQKKDPPGHKRGYFLWVGRFRPMVSPGQTLAGTK